MESYTFPYLEAGQYDKARCDFFGPFVSQQNAYSAASKEALKEIRKKQVFVDASVYEASTTLESCIFTLMPVLTVFTLALGGFAFTTDAQRTRLAAIWKSVTNGWNRLVNRNRVYNFETSDKITTDSGMRIDVQGEARYTEDACLLSGVHIFAVRPRTNHWSGFLRNLQRCSFAFAAFCFWPMRFFSM